MSKRLGVNYPSDHKAVFIPRYNRLYDPRLLPEPRPTFRSVVVSPHFKNVRDYVYTDPQGNLQKGSQVSEGTSFVRSSSFSGYTNPFWKSQIIKGQNACTDANGTRYLFDVGWFTALADSNDDAKPPTRYKTEWYGYPSISVPDNYQPDAPTITSVTNRAISKFFDRADAALSSVESGQDFGEIRQSLDSMIRPLNSLRSHVLSYFPSVKKLKGKYKKVPDLKKALADTYLEWTFGWRPLALDVADAYVGLQNRKRFFDIVPIKSSAKQDFHGSSDSGIIDTSGDGQLKLWLTTQSNSVYSVRYKGAVRTGAVNSQVSVSQVLQIDLPHFLPTAWDLLPYSFIVDYFTNIGDIIRAYSFRTSSVLWCVKTTRVENRKVFVHEVRPDIPPTWKNFASLPGVSHSSCSQVSFVRTSVDAAYLRPKLNFSIPTSAKPWINLGALMLARSLPLVPFFK